MSVGLLLITHGRMGEELARVARHLLGEPPLTTAVVAVDDDPDPQMLAAVLARQIVRLDSGDGVLLLTDLCGATPSNIAHAATRNAHCRLVAGINLPMLIRLYNYPVRDLDAAAGIALDGGRRGVVSPETIGQDSDDA